ncbi:GspE/PulE family protein [Alkalimarinus sediminis]|uniref:GspE/PulE family protein n=1 Tax=Alkalimarinus sediminis TaxID=1632866 RepID=A0A9E8HJ44_9ALTE|nr:GspE/PulE family protein [Alkalimarinus sediminis]UZW75615.1 GspE/PulE family protein [Alkalimarinus sediminis]
MNNAVSQTLKKTLTLSDIVNQLLADGIINQEDSDQLFNQTKSREQLSLHPLEIVAAANLKNRLSDTPLTLDSLSQWLADWADQPLFHIDPLNVDANASANAMSFAFAQRHGILAVDITPTQVVIASAQPFVDGWVENLQHVLRKSIKHVVVNPADLKRFTVEFYQLANSVSKATGQSQSSIQNFEQMLQLGSEANPDANDQHIVNIVDWLLQYAFEQRASDIHIEPRREIVQVRFRIDGVLHNVYELPAQVGIAVISRLKILGRLNVAEKRKPQDGRIKTKGENDKEIELRLSTLPTAFGEKMVMRIFDPDVLLRSFPDLGFSAEDTRRWEGMAKQPNGIILVTGPTGSGKTTTLYSTLRQLATTEVNVCTIEDPIEMVEPLFNQMQVQPNIDLSFSSGIKALMRQDPDIIMIGEIRDLETAEMATQAALTGHLVLSTLHTNDAPSTITRLIELGVPSYIIKATVLGVMAQRLVRTLCPKCKEPHPIDEEAWKSITAPWRAPLPQNTCRPVGCLECRDTGYKGRAGVYEIMPISNTLKPIISDNCDLELLRKQAIKEGMHSLRLSGANKVGAGLTTIEEVLRVTPQSMRQ